MIYIFQRINKNNKIFNKIKIKNIWNYILIFLKYNLQTNKVLKKKIYKKMKKIFKNAIVFKY